ncbi:MAG: BON domain-containing protein [Proteobacteria bacterium]|nr:BON domain-containing protein [Pseudomonadota bacterium]
MKRLCLKIFISILCVCLTGCIPLIIAAVGATAGGAIIYDKRSSKVILQDQEITNKALGILNSDLQLKGVARVSISTFDHIVLMVGQVKSEYLRQRAYDDVSQVPSIRRIYNQVQISSVLTALDQSKDAWITSKVKSAMLAKSGLRSSQIKVVTEDKVVYLMGLVTPNQAKLATEVARNVSGVEKVVQVFEYET